VTARARRWTVAVSAAGVGALLLGVAGPAAAIPRADIDSIPVVAPRDSEPGPPTPMRQKTKCAVSASFAGSDIDKPAPANVVFEVDDLHRFSTGKGVTVAVIDSGVEANERLPRLKGGGDYIGSTDGLADCDHHGTLIAGIIGASPSDEDGFVGVAPDASLISIRQTSAAYEPVDADGPNSSSTLSTLARAVVHAASMGADVINLSVTACVGPGQGVEDDLAKALRWAAEDKDVVIVASAGNSTSENSKSCKQNPGFDPANAGDRRNWDGVETVSMPSYYSPLVLSVGGATLTGDPYPGTLTGPWIDVAAPAEMIVSLDPSSRSGGLINAQSGPNGVQPISGTSFSAAYVSGLAALIRSRHPELTAKQVRERIVNTAMTPSTETESAFGYGLVDPVSALTVLEQPAAREDGPRSQDLAESPPVHDNTWIKTLVALGGVAAATILAAVLVGWNRLRRTTRSTSQNASKGR
jgi:membrane-anchored mycosin MYCP